MTAFPRRLLIGALTLFLFTTSCNLPIALTPPLAGNGPAPDMSPVPTRPSGARSDPTPTVLIPVTGIDVPVSLRCQFCVHAEPHAVITMPEAASFSVLEPMIGITCLTAQVANGQRVLLCRGPQQTPFTLNVCTDSGNCAQVPFLLETCPRNPQDAIPTPRATATLPAPVVVVTTDPTRIPRAQPSVTSAPAASPTAAPALNTQPPAASGLQTPEGFIRWYFAAVWNERNYENLWNNYLTPNFKAKVGSGIYEDYVSWWNSVLRVDVNSVEVIQNNGTHAWVRVNMNFHMQDGRNINNQEYEYNLLYDAARGTWLFD